MTLGYVHGIGVDFKLTSLSFVYDFACENCVQVVRRFVNSTIL